MSQTMKFTKLAKEAGAGILGMFFVMVLGMAIAGAGEMAAWVVLSVGMLIFIAMGFLVLYWAVRPDALRADVEQDLEKGEVGDFYVAGLPALFCASFLLSANAMWVLWGDSVFVGAEANRFTRFGYLFDNLIRAGALDFAETFYWRISPIQHADYWPVALFVFAFRTTVSVALIGVIARSFSIWRTRGGEDSAPNTGGS